MGTSPPQRSSRARWGIGLTLAVAVLTVGVAAAMAGRYLTVLVESPLIAPTRENPPLFVVVTAVLWIVPTVIAIGTGEWAGHLARLKAPARRRWRWIYAGVVLTVWVVTVLLYVNDPMTAIRWRQHG